VGQDAAVDAVVDVVMRIHAGLTDPARPYATYLFTGPTGTGKTELAKALADYLYGSSARLLRFDMGEYNAADAPARSSVTATRRAVPSRRRCARRPSRWCCSTRSRRRIPAFTTCCCSSWTRGGCATPKATRPTSPTP
jgi:hypothetical protein